MHLILHKHKTGGVGRRKRNVFSLPAFPKQIDGSYLPDRKHNQQNNKPIHASILPLIAIKSQKKSPFRRYIGTGCSYAIERLSRSLRTRSVKRRGERGPLSR